MKTLFLHIGTAKTATSSIQEFCAKNREVLEKKGYCFPKSLYKYPVVRESRNAHFLIGKVYDEEGNRNLQEEERLFHQGMEEMHRCFGEYEKVVMSDESLWLSSNSSHKDLWSVLKDDAEKYGYMVKIIVYLRRQDEYLSSRWNQFVKEGTTVETWEHHFKNAPVKRKAMLDYAANLSRISGFFGKENILVRRFSRDSFFGGSIYADFLQCLGLELTGEYTQLEEDVNLALKGNITEIMRVMNTSPVLTRYNNLYWRRMVSMCSEESDKNYKCSMLSKEETEEFLELYREDNERVAQEYIGDGKPLFHYDAAETVKWEKQNETMLDDMIRVFTVLAYDSHEEITALKEKVRTLEKDNQELKKKSEDLKRQVAENRLSVENISRKSKRYIRKKLGMK